MFTPVSICVSVLVLQRGGDCNRVVVYIVHCYNIKKLEEVFLFIVVIIKILFLVVCTMPLVRPCKLK
jgi:hypothetical protein